MLKLLKYEYRRKRERVLAFFVIMLLVQAGIWITNRSMGTGLLSINMLTYGVFGYSMVISAIISYDRYLRSYARRLVPVPVVQNVLSPLLFCWVLLLSVVGIAALHLGMYILAYSPDFLNEHFWTVAAWNVFYFVWLAGFELILLMFVITVVRSLRIKGKIWIGIAVFMVLENGLNFIEMQIWGNQTIGLENAFRFSIYQTSPAPSNLKVDISATNFWAFLFEAVIGAILVYVTILLVKKRIEN
ncbi:hypothetical protein [Paenibacillus sp. HW567]|uniref:hypothetical protein n=1 Tax=Paenibacillus sp. HW567 TaxID=1034769 RepID=UPI00037C6B8F|nr:hypothetical protein [Paenibacillus sp. HW567]